MTNSLEALIASIKPELKIALDKTQKQSDALLAIDRLSDLLTLPAVDSLIAALEQAQTERDNFKFAFTEWHDKTEWVQEQVTSGRFNFPAVGMHRADVMTRHIEEQEAELERAKKEIAKLIDERTIAREAVRRIAELEVACDRSYIAGMKTGWNYCDAGNSDGFNTCVEQRRKLTREANPTEARQLSAKSNFYRDGIEAAARFIDNQRESHDNEHGRHDPDTGTFEFGSDAQRDYSTTLAELAEGIRALHPNAGASQLSAKLSYALRSFITDADIKALDRFAECCDDPDAGGHDLQPDQVQRLVSIGILRKSGRNYHETTDFGDFVLSLGGQAEGE
jgi:hypothetical protein